MNRNNLNSTSTTVITDKSICSENNKNKDTTTNCILKNSNLLKRDVYYRNDDKGTNHSVPTLYMIGSKSQQNCCIFKNDSNSKLENKNQTRKFLIDNLSNLKINFKNFKSNKYRL